MPAPKAGSVPKTSKASIREVALSGKEKELVKLGYEEVKKPDVSHVPRSLRVEGVDGDRLSRNADLPRPHPRGEGPILVEDGEPKAPVHDHSRSH